MISYFIMEHQKKLIWKQRLRLYNKQKTKNSISLPLDPLWCKEAIRRANYQLYYLLHCTGKISTQPLLKSNGCNYKEQLNMLVPVWFDGPQFSPSIIRNKVSRRKRFYHQLRKSLENQNKLTHF